MAGGGWRDHHSLYERLSPLIASDQFLVVNKVETDRDMGFGGETTYTVAITVKGPRSSEEFYIESTAYSREEAISNIEKVLR